MRSPSTDRRSAWLASVALFLVGMVFASAPASAQSSCPRCTVGDAGDALPGLSTSAVPQLQRAVSASIVGAGTYGLNVDPIGPGSMHHRVGGAIAGAVHVVPWLAIGLRMNGRFDVVSAGGRSDDGLFGYPTLALRLSAEPVAGLTIGLDAQVMVLGGEAPSFELGSTSALLRAMGAYAVDLGGSRLVLVLNAGYFIDNSRAAAPRGITDNLSAEDRLSLGVSDSGAVVASLGAAYVGESIEIFGDVGVRIYTEGTVLSSSPLRLGLGARFWAVPEVFFVGVGADVRLTPQAAGLAGASTTNAPIEPALQAHLTVGVRIGAETPPTQIVADDEPEPQPEPEPEPEVEPTVGAAHGTLAGDGGPIAGGTVEITSTVDQSVRSATSGADGAWRIDGLPLGGATYRITAEGHDAVEGTLTVEADSPDLSTTLARSLPQGEIRGVIQASNGQPLSARVVIRPLGRELTADAEGAFAIEVPPGEYDVAVSAPGHRDQTRHVTVAENGVVVLNIQLRAGRGR